MGFGAIDTVVPLTRVSVESFTILCNDIVICHTKIYFHDEVCSCCLESVEDLIKSAGAEAWTYLSCLKSDSLTAAAMIKPSSIVIPLKPRCFKPPSIVIPFDSGCLKLAYSLKITTRKAMTSSAHASTMKRLPIAEQKLISSRIKESDANKCFCVQ